MAKKKTPRKRKPKGQRPPPKCKAILLCNHTIVEAMTGNVSIINTFDRFSLASFPGMTVPCTIFLQLTDGIGRYDIVIEIHDLGRNQILGRAAAIGVEWGDRLQRLNLVVPMPAIPLQHPGDYDLVVLANQQEIDRQKFSAVPIGGQGDADPNAN